MAESLVIVKNNVNSFRANFNYIDRKFKFIHLRYFGFREYQIRV